MKGKIVLLLTLFIISGAINVIAENEVDLYLFKSAGCSYCASMEQFLNEKQEEYPGLNVREFEVKENTKLLFLLADKYELDLTERISIPIVFINTKVMVGYNEDIANTLETYIKECIESYECISPVDKLKENVTQTTGGSTDYNTGIEGLTFGAVTIAAAVDAINPCAFAVLIILLTTILAAKKRKRVIGAGLAFSASIFISYFLMGIGLYSAVQASGVTHIFYIVVAILAILIGIFNLKDYFWYGKWFIMEVPISWRPKMKAVIKGVTSIPGAFLVGFVVSLFLLPCTSGPYIVILGLLAKATTKQMALMYLLYYNLIFILPMLLITLAIGFGFTTTEEAEEWRQKKLKILHLVAGIIILLLGIGMLISVGFGLI